jgi:hypothetical protein
MAENVLREIVIPPEEATFWLDRWGNWCNRHGRFQHRKIITYFHAAIARDKDGYYVSQVNGDMYEKVYFRFEDTALFVFEVLAEDEMTLVLNTGRRIGLDPGSLFIRNDYLYMRDGSELIKFNEISMLKISRFFEHAGDQCFLRFGGQRIAIPVMDDETPPGDPVDRSKP